MTFFRDAQYTAFVVLRNFENKMTLSRFDQDTAFEFLRNFENQNDIVQKRSRDIVLNRVKH